ncbi:MAG: FecR domain-containing protein, partial [Chloroflexi bacterium]|nr:FecR domain-containing protein [Chloroflexota bacterium]
MENQVVMRASPDTAWFPATVGAALQGGYEVQTGPEGRARIDFTEGSILRLAPNTMFAFEELNQDAANPVTRLQLAAGQLFLRLGNLLGQDGAMEVITPPGVASVRGSLISVAFDPQTNQMVVVCYTGLCEATNGAGRVTFTDQQQVVILSPDLPPQAPQPLTPEQARDFQQNIPDLQQVLADEERLRSQQASATAEAENKPTHEPPGLSRTPAPPGRTKPPGPPGRTKTPGPPGRTKTPEPPGRTKTPQ